jgi:hypothetical protein
MTRSFADEQTNRRSFDCGSRGARAFAQDDNFVEGVGKSKQPQVPVLVKFGSEGLRDSVTGQTPYLAVCDSARVIISE